MSPCVPQEFMRLQRMGLENLLIWPGDLSCQANMLDEWTWLIGSQKRPFLFSAFGDAFVQDMHDGAIEFLDVSAAHLSRIAETAEAMEKLLCDPAFVETYLRPHIVEDLRSRDRLLKPNQIYSLRIPRSLGGDVTLENIEIIDVEVHFSITGQIERQIADFPEGTAISGFKFEGLRKAKPWWRFW
jgi:hypothetical protein